MESRTDGTRPWSSARAGVALAVLLLAVYLPGLSALPVVDRDEARFAQASRQMLESVTLPRDQRDERPLSSEADGAGVRGGMHAGGLGVPMLGEGARLSKPPLVYWLQAGSAGVFTLADPTRDAVWMYRLPSVFAAVVACLAVWRTGVGMGSSRAGWLGGLVLGVCPMVVWDAHQARADQVLMACSAVALLALARVRRDDAPTRWSWVLWIAVGLGVLAKGPILPMALVLCVGTMCVVERRWDWLSRLRPMIGCAIVLVMVAPWVWAVSSRVGFDVLLRIVIDETLGRSTEPREGHWGPPGYHLVLLPVLLWPGALVLLRAMRLGFTGWRRGPATPETLVLAWAAPAWLVFEIVGTKLPHYTLPLYPALALLAMRLVCGDTPDPARRPGPVPNAIGVGLWMLIGAALFVAGPVAFGMFDGTSPARWWAFGTAGACAVGVLLAGAMGWSGRPARASVLAVCVCVMVGIGMVGGALPRAGEVWVTRAIERAAGDTSGVRYGAVGYHEDSLMFAARGRLDRLTPDGVDGWAARHPGGVLVLPEVVPPPSGALYRATVHGWNYSKGERVRLRVYRVPKTSDAAISPASPDRAG